MESNVARRARFRRERKRNAIFEIADARAQDALDRINGNENESRTYALGSAVIDALDACANFGVIGQREMIAAEVISRFLTLESKEKETVPWIELDRVSSVYSGKPGCCCGCLGKHTYASAHRKWAGASRGYEIADEEIGDRTVKMIVNKLNRCPDLRDGGNHYHATINGRLYIAYKAGVDFDGNPDPDPQARRAEIRARMIPAPTEAEEKSREAREVQADSQEKN